MFRLKSIESVIEHLTDFQTLSYTTIEDVALSGVALETLMDGTFLRCDFSGVAMPDNLENALFVDCHLGGLHFNKTNFFNSRFIHCDFSQSHFLECDLSAAQFEECCMTATEFYNCDLETAEVIEAPAPSLPSMTLRHHGDHRGSTLALKHQ
jgi:uncharacterized protein YjbI with pentapeptide repeats